jgi:hypothetical protein
MKSEINNEDPPMPEAQGSSVPSHLSAKSRENTRLQKLIEKGSPEQLEAEVRKSLEFLATLKAPLSGMVDQHKDANYFTQQIQLLRN